LNRAVNTYWTDTRLAAQRPAARALTLPAPAREAAGDYAEPIIEARRRRLVIPSWVTFTMIILATFALCVTVTMRTHAEMRSAAQKFERMTEDVETLRNNNAEIEREVQELRTNPRAIEAAARTRLNMVRANEIVVPID